MMKKITTKTTWMVMVLLTSFIFSCDRFDTCAQYTYQQPEKINDGIDGGYPKKIAYLNCPICNKP